MMFVVILMLLGFLVYFNIYAERKPILYLINAAILLLLSAESFTSPGHNWVNNVWGVVMFLFAIFYAKRYFKLRR